MEKLDWTLWAREDAEIGVPSRSRDSPYLYFDELRTNDTHFRHFGLHESQSERLFSLNGFD